MFQGVKRIDYNDFRINVRASCLTKSSRREHTITPGLKKLHWLKIHDRIIYKLLMLTYKSYYNIPPLIYVN